MIKAQQLTVQQMNVIPEQTEVVVYQPSTVTSQGFLDMMSIMSSMIPLFIMVMMMSMMRGFIEKPEAVRKAVGEAVTYIPVVGPSVGAAIKGE